MTAPRQNDPGGDRLQHLDDTMRLIATVPAPEGLADRLKANLRTASRGGRVIAWPRTAAPGGWMQSPVLRGAAAAAIVCVVAGGGWQIYTRVPAAPSARVIEMPARIGNSGAFSNANAMRTPDTLNRPKVPQAAAPEAPAPPAADAKANQPEAPIATGKTSAQKKKPVEAPR